MITLGLNSEAKSLESKICSEYKEFWDTFTE
jgi:hypothetical protein